MNCPSQDPTAREWLKRVQWSWGHTGRQPEGGGRHGLSRGKKADRGQNMKVPTHHKRNLQAPKQPLKGFELVMIATGESSRKLISSHT